MPKHWIKKCESIILYFHCNTVCVGRKKNIAKYKELIILLKCSIYFIFYVYSFVYSFRLSNSTSSVQSFRIRKKKQNYNLKTFLVTFQKWRRCHFGNINPLWGKPPGGHHCAPDIDGHQWVYLISKNFQENKVFKPLAVTHSSLPLTMILRKGGIFAECTQTYTPVFTGALL